jgi:hypothetical protein
MHAIALEYLLVEHGVPDARELDARVRCRRAVSVGDTGAAFVPFA